MSGIQKALDTFALPVNHFALPPVASDDSSDGKMPARRYSSCSSTSWQLTIDLSFDDDLPSGNDNSDIKSDCYPESTDVDMKEVETQDVEVRKSRQLQRLSVEEEEYNFGQFNCFAAGYALLQKLVFQILNLI